MVSDVQVSEIDAVKGLDLGTDRPRVVQRRGDQLVKTDQLDVERLAHMGAAIAQDLHHLRPVLYRVEMRLHRLRLRCHFAQRQRSRKYLHENYVHGKHENTG